MSFSMLLLVHFQCEFTEIVNETKKTKKNSNDCVQKDKCQVGQFAGNENISRTTWTSHFA